MTEQAKQFYKQNKNEYIKKFRQFVGEDFKECYTYEEIKKEFRAFMWDWFNIKIDLRLAVFRDIFKGVIQ